MLFFVSISMEVMNFIYIKFLNNKCIFLYRLLISKFIPFEREFFGTKNEMKRLKFENFKICPLHNE